MDIKSSEGVIPILCLPNGAICRAAGKPLDEVTSCPITMFDHLGERCVPDLCEHYSEEEYK